MTGADATAPVAQLRDVGLRYRKTRALEAVSLDIPAGCMAGVFWLAWNMLKAVFKFQRESRK